ncbi:MAG: FecR family protein [Elusimicrobiota bacterium]
MKKILIIACLAAGALLAPRFSFCAPKSPASPAKVPAKTVAAADSADNISFGEAKVSMVSGTAEVKETRKIEWKTIKAGEVVRTEDSLKTMPRSRAKVELSDGSNITVLPNSRIDFRNLKKDTPTIKVIVGRIRAWVSKNTARSKFEVHTPVAICSVRGTEFEVTVDENGKTDIEVFEGLLGVRREDGTGEEIPVGAGERLGVDLDTPLDRSMKSELGNIQQDVRYEVGLDMSKDQVQANAAQEMKLAEYQEGKTMIDVFGQRVRIEEYIMRPAADTFKFVVLNERESRFDYFYYKGQFNQTLPSDLSVALRDLNGKIDTAPEYYLLAYETGRSNTLDKIEEQASGGHLVDVNNNTPTDDDVTSYYNADTDTFETVDTGRVFYQPLFNNYTYKINSNEKISWEPKSGITNIQSALDLKYTYAGQVMWTGTEWPSGTNVMNQRINVYYGDGTWEKWDNYIINDEGQTASKSDFNNITTGADYKAELLKWNYEQVITASEFGGRKIDLCVEPKILIKSGLIK